MSSARARASGRVQQPVRRPARALLRGHDHGEPVVVDAPSVGADARSHSWIDPFLRANGAGLDRLGLAVSVLSAREPSIALRPSARIGAIPLLAASTRRVVAGLLIEPRFKWQSLGAIYRSIGFEVAPNVGGGVLVPGSARHVPPWLLAAPVVARIEAVLQQRKRAFVEVRAERESPRGRVDWSTWARSNVPSGRWSSFPCTYSEPTLDPLLAANLRWTTRRLREDLGHANELEVGRALLLRLDDVDAQLGDGPRTRPASHVGGRDAGAVLEAIEAMGWVADERGLGGAIVLDGLAWDVSIDAVWEAWVRRFVADLGPRLGLREGGERTRQISLRWQGSVHSMRKLKPDASLLSAERTVWFDAKYKPHLAHLQQRGWFGAGETVQTEHRADLHQTIAYAACGSTPNVDAVLVYPSLGGESLRISSAEISNGARRSRIVLGALPFGFQSPDHREQTLRTWREALATES